jgi:hypothetical protein
MFVLLSGDLPIHRQQPHPLHAGVMRQVDYVGHILEVDIVIAAHEYYFLCALQIDLRQPRFQIFPTHVVLIDLHRG